MYTQPRSYPLSVDVVTPTGPMSIEWRALCVQLGVAKARALLQNWERAKTPLKDPLGKVRVGVFTHSNTYGCMDYWEVTNVRYRDSLVRPVSKAISMEGTWSLMKKALLYKLF